MLFQKMQRGKNAVLPESQKISTNETETKQKICI